MGKGISPTRFDPLGSEHLPLKTSCLHDSCESASPKMSQDEPTYSGVSRGRHTTSENLFRSPVNHTSRRRLSGFNVDYTPVHVYTRPLEPQARSGFSSRFLFGPDVLLQHARGFVPGLLPDLEFRHSVVEGGGSETGAKRVGAIAVEVADAGAPPVPFSRSTPPRPGSGRPFARFHP